jgi:hypothetical protein
VDEQDDTRSNNVSKVIQHWAIKRNVKRGVHGCVGADCPTLVFSCPDQAAFVAARHSGSLCSECHPALRRAVCVAAVGAAAAGVPWTPSSSVCFTQGTWCRPLQAPAPSSARCCWNQTTSCCHTAAGSGALWHPQRPGQQERQALVTAAT